jgi:protein SCO1/2
LRLALLDASEGKALSLGNKLLLFCYHYDSGSKGYVLFALKFMEIGGFFILSLMAIFIIFIWRLEKKRKGLLTGLIAK